MYEAAKFTRTFFSSDDLKRLASAGVSPARKQRRSGSKISSFRQAGITPISFVFEKLYDWLFVPITLWPIDIEGLFREALDRVAAGRRLDKTMIFLIDLLPPLPSNRTQRAVSEHEHLVQRGNYEPLIRARHKYDQIESQLASNPEFQAQWNAIKAQFD